MITEDYTSREENDTQDGFSAVRYFTCTWVDWTNQYGSFTDPDLGVINPWYFPQVGDEWPYTDYADDEGYPIYRDIAVTHRRARAVANNNTDCRIDIAYSTDASIGRNQAGQVGSWEESLSTGFTETSIDVWKDTDGVFKEWKKVWAAAGSVQGATVDNAPSLPGIAGATTLTLSATGPRVLYQTLLRHTGKVNEDNFLNALSNRKAAVNPRYRDDTADFDDIGKWLFAGFTRDRIRRNAYRYQFQFLYDGDGWNYYTGVASITDDPATPIDATRATESFFIPLKMYRTFRVVGDVDEHGDPTGTPGLFDTMDLISTRPQPGLR